MGPETFAWLYVMDLRSRLEDTCKLPQEELVKARSSEAEEIVWHWYLPKCKFGYTDLEFVGHTIRKGVVKPETDKIEQILNAPRPTTKTQVKSFLGLVGDYRDYIPHFANIAVPLTDLLRKGQTLASNSIGQSLWYDLSYLEVKGAVFRYRMYIIIIDCN